MKKIVFAMSLALVAGSMSMMAQEKKQRMGNRPNMNSAKMIEHRVNRVAESLKLDDATRAKFTETYSEYLNAQMELRKAPAQEMQCEMAGKHECTEKKECGMKDCAAKKCTEKKECGMQECGKEKQCDKKHCAKPKTDKAVADAQQARLANEKKQLELKETYYKKMSEFLNPQQLDEVFFTPKAQVGRGAKMNRGQQQMRPERRRGDVERMPRVKK